MQTVREFRQSLQGFRLTAEKLQMAVYAPKPSFVWKIARQRLKVSKKHPAGNARDEKGTYRPNRHILFLDAAAKVQNPWLPSVLERVALEDGVAYKVEELTPAKASAGMSIKKLLDSQKAIRGGTAILKDVEAVEDEALREACKLIADLYIAHGGELDLHRRNFMMRGEQLVINDPLY